MKRPSKQNLKHAVSNPTVELRALRDEQLRACAGGWNIPEGVASPSC